MSRVYGLIDTISGDLDHTVYEETRHHYEHDYNLRHKKGINIYRFLVLNDTKSVLSHER